MSDTETKTTGGVPAEANLSPRISSPLQSDLLLLVACLGALPLVWLFTQDVWLRTNYHFLLGIAFIPIPFAIGRCRLLRHSSLGRTRWAMFFFALGAVSLACGAMLLSPWMGVLALIAMLSGWLLERCGSLPWYEAIGLTAPLWLLLLLPPSDSIDPLNQLLPLVSQSASNLLDLSGIPHVAYASHLDLKSGTMPVVSVLQGLESPYVLVCLALIFCLVVRPSLLICSILVLSTLLWSWFGATLHLYIGTMLLERADMQIFSPLRHTIVQLAVLIFQFLIVWMFYVGLKILFSPFEALSEGVGFNHRIFNWFVLWPETDPLRRRRSESASASPRLESISPGSLIQNQRVFLFITVAVGIVFAGGGALVAQTLLSSLGWFGIAQQSQNAQQFVGSITEDSLPTRIAGWQRIAYETTIEARTSASKVRGNTWTYSNGAQTFSLTLVGAYRGAFPAELALRNSGYKVKSMGKAFRFVRPSAEEPPADSAGTDSNPTGADAWSEYREFIANDPVYGEAYVAYASIAVPPRADKPSVEDSIVESLRLQPTVLSLRLAALGAEGLREEDRLALQNVLQMAVQELQSKLPSMP